MTLAIFLFRAQTDRQTDKLTNATDRLTYLDLNSTVHDYRADVHVFLIAKIWFDTMDYCV